MEFYARVKRDIEKEFGEDVLDYTRVEDFQRRLSELFRRSPPPSWERRREPTFRIIDALTEQWLEEMDRWAPYGIRAVVVSYPWGTEVRYAISGLRGLWGREMAEMIAEISREMMEWTYRHYGVYPVW